MYMDIFNLSHEVGITVKAHAFRMQGATTREIEAQASPHDDLWITVARIDDSCRRASITVGMNRVYLTEVTDIDITPKASGLFPVLTVTSKEH